MRSRTAPTVAPRRAAGPIDWSRSRHEMATNNSGQIGWRTRREHHSLILTANNHGFCRVRGEASRSSLETVERLFSGRQHPCSQQLETRSSVTLSLQQFELVHEALHAAVRPTHKIVDLPNSR